MSSKPDHHAAEPGWLRRLKLLVLRHGMARSVAALTALVALLALLISEAVVAVLGRGDATVAALASTLCSLLLTPLLATPVLRLVLHLEAVRAELDALAIRDDLTGVHNRRHFMATVRAEWERALRYRTPAALLLVDADDFKGVNDRHGHLCGDELLRRIAAAIAGALRHVDVLARFGGEEFIVFLPHTEALGALDAAERIRACVQATRLAWEGQHVETTVSIGIACFAPGRTLDGTIGDADTALYAAKAAGRNRVRVFDGDALQPVR